MVVFASRWKHCVQRTNIQNLKAIHNSSLFVESISTNCVQRTNIQNLKAIHNWISMKRIAPSIVFKERIYKI